MVVLWTTETRSLLLWKPLWLEKDQGQLSLLPSPGWEMSSTGRNAVMLCSWEVKAGWLIPFVNKRVGGR